MEEDERVVNVVERKGTDGKTSSTTVAHENTHPSLKGRKITFDVTNVIDRQKKKMAANARRCKTKVK